MSAAADSRAETAKLARLLGLADPGEIAYLAGVPADELRRYREALTDELFDGDRSTFQRLAHLACLVPARTAATVSERALGPLICARVTGLVEPARAAEIGSHLSVDFLARLAAELDPRRAAEVIGGIAPETVGRVAAAMARNGEHVAMGRFVGFLDSSAIAACATRLDDADLLRIGFVLEGDVDVLVEVFGAARAAELLDRGRKLGLAEEAESILARVSARRRAAIEAHRRAPSARHASTRIAGPAAALS